MLTVARSEPEPGNAEVIAGVINRAFMVEAWFVEGDRTSPPDVLKLLQSPSAAFFVAVEDEAVLGCIYADRTTPDRGYIGLLAVEPERGGGGLGRLLMARAEDYLRSAGCQTVEITVVDLRTELFPFYERGGYRRTGATFEFPRPSKRPCHLVLMTKPLDPA